jgi:Flp pilus assembly protein TadD
MSDMLANRYLLNNEPEKAIELYREALQKNRHTEGVRCKLIAACLRGGQIDLALSELSTMLDLKGAAVLHQLGNSCRGYVPRKELASDDPTSIGLWLVLEGEVERARRVLADANMENSSQNGGLLARLLDVQKTQAEASSTDENE